MTHLIYMVEILFHLCFLHIKRERLLNLICVVNNPLNL